MARTCFALPVAGLNPNDPTLAPGLALSLTTRQQRELTAALRRAPQPALVVRLVRESLQQRQPIPRILEDLRTHNALVILRQYAAPPQGRTALYRSLPTVTDASRDRARPAHHAAPAPNI